MSKSRLFLMLAISLAMAIGAALVARNWLKERIEPRTAADPETATVVMATTEIPFGESVEASHLRLQDVPVELRHDAAFAAVDEVVGQVATQMIYPGEMIIAPRIAQSGGGSGLAAVLEQGKRAVTVRVNDVLGVAGFLLPGNRVDVVATRRSNGANNDIASETILSDIQVLAVDQLASQADDDPIIVRAVTLAVTPEQAERLVRATQEGQVQLTLRNPFEKAAPLVAAEEPVPEPEAKPTPPQPRRVYRPTFYNVEVIRGTSSSSQKVND